MRMPFDPGPPLAVEVEVEDDRMRLQSGDVEIADWSIDDLRVSALEDGFHIRAEGEDVVLEVDDDAHFAIELGLKNAHPALRKKMSHILRSED